MPPLKKKGACATGTHAFTQHLEAELLEARRRVQETAECVTSARHREAVRGLARCAGVYCHAGTVARHKPGADHHLSCE
jgi:hypothetical protein